MIITLVTCAVAIVVTGGIGIYYRTKYATMTPNQRRNTAIIAVVCFILFMAAGMLTDRLIQ
jgi:hypothetical protein